MKTMTVYLRLFWLLSITQCCLWPAVGADAPVPAGIERGFNLLKTAGAVPAFEVWRGGGVLEDAAKTKEETNKFKEMVRPLGNYRSYEVIEVKEIGKTSKILYVSMSFDRGVLYGSFLTWKSERDWIVQQMDFNIKPEVIMPWLMLGGGK